MITTKHKKQIEERGLFDFISSEYWKLSKDDIVTLCKEFNYAVYAIDKEICKEAEKNMWEEIEVEEPEEE